VRENKFALGFYHKKDRMPREWQSVVLKRRNTKNRNAAQQVLRVVEATRRTCWHPKEERLFQLGTRMSCQRYTIRLHGQSVESIAAFRSVNRVAALR